MEASRPTTTTARRTFLAGALGTLGLLAGSRRVSADYVPGVVATAPSLPDRQHPTMGTDESNPTAVVFLTLSDPAARTFVRGRLEDVVETYVRPGHLNVELRFLAYDPADPARELDGGAGELALSSRTAAGVWALEPGNFWRFFEYAFWNFSTWPYTERRLESLLRAGGVRNHVKIPSLAGEGRWDETVRAATEEARRFSLRAPYVPTVRLLADTTDGRDSGLLDWLAGRLDRVAEGSVTRRTLLPGTKYATPLHVIDSGRPGPTALVVGGVHGDEEAGFATANRLTDLRPATGRVVVLPEANRPAIAAGRRATREGDLNRQFPTGRTPTSRLAHAIWDVVERYDPDVVVDCHTARGIYNHDSSVGQAIFPTVAGAGIAGDACDRVNDLFFAHDDRPHYYDFDRGNLLDGDRPMLVHKCYGDRRLPAYIVETTRKRTRLEERLVWEFTAVVSLLDAHGVRCC
ncbi:succinylglutamate desuccinylase/aspartoacylase family protein [Salinirubrum litoreum]|uniref:Succinylglutamate desuccinylase/aspartoacylase family protein n=1 Tax=Salinirubrum litoreum TaxID=1126234 RepID=A0ABD5RCQ6_9EURY|nr:succinylglutamate desuccinylase/aspartoacylase family protein [Salinirubrum litoreum]